MPITPEKLAELKALCDAATEGPWFRLEPPWLPSDVKTTVLAGNPDPHVGKFVCDFEQIGADDDESNDWSDAAFIAAARTAMPALIAEVVRLAAENAARLREVADLKARAERAEAAADEPAMTRAITEPWPHTAENVCAYSTVNNLLELRFPGEPPLLRIGVDGSISMSPDATPGLLTEFSSLVDDEGYRCQFSGLTVNPRRLVLTAADFAAAARDVARHAPKEDDR